MNFSEEISLSICGTITYSVTICGYIFWATIWSATDLPELYNFLLTVWFVMIQNICSEISPVWGIIKGNIEHSCTDATDAFIEICSGCTLRVRMKYSGMHHVYWSRIHIWISDIYVSIDKIFGGFTCLALITNSKSPKRFGERLQVR